MRKGGTAGKERRKSGKERRKRATGGKGVAAAAVVDWSVRGRRKPLLAGQKQAFACKVIASIYSQRMGT